MSEFVPTASVVTDADAVVVWTGTRDGALALGPGAGQVDDAFGGRLLEALSALGASGEAGDVARVPALGALKAPLVVAVGTGRLDVTGDARLEAWRAAAGTAARAVSGRETVALTVPDVPGAAGAICEGWQLGGHAFTRYKTGDVPRPTVRVLLAGPVSDPEVHQAAAVADAVALCRDLVATPAADLTPAAFATAAQQQGDEYGLDVDVWDTDRLRAEGFGATLGVGQGSANPPRLVRAAYRPPQATRTVALVGKGITFDSGGLNMKSGEALASMKGDMAGAAVSLAVAVAAARLGLDVGVVAWLGLAENMPGGGAIRPSDVLRSYNGTTIEVGDTDAEGRLVLADVLARAAEEAPDVIVDVTTLTGAHVPAVGLDYMAVVSDDTGLRDALVAAGEAVGEPLWPVPMGPSLRPQLDSAIADLRNIGQAGVGKLAVSALFLRQFVPDDVAWAHLDIIGPMTNRGEPRGYRPVGPTGVGVRALLRWLADQPA